MKRFKLEQSEKEIYTATSGLALAGACLDRYVNLDKELKKAQSLRRGISHADLLAAIWVCCCRARATLRRLRSSEKIDFSWRHLA
uniref:Uncharacterized protein n=1 Tax=Magnetococcus massalia (strain MO-1) TaxID=451514 RepID=A0A1S7LK66_MAGMO|nr:Protein of unknown function [Candidatus Magnetococcus massalia]